MCSPHLEPVIIYHTAVTIKRCVGLIVLHLIAES